MTTNTQTTQTFPLPALTEIPEIGSALRNQHEEDALARGFERLHEREGGIREALWDLELDLRGAEYRPHPQDNVARNYARTLVRHVEQCWAAAIAR